MSEPRIKTKEQQALHDRRMLNMQLPWYTAVPGKRIDILETLHKQMMDAISDRDKYRGQRDEIKKAIRDECRLEIVTEIKQLSLWGRLKLCFNPFGEAP